MVSERFYKCDLLKKCCKNSKSLNWVIISKMKVNSVVSGYGILRGCPVVDEEDKDPEFG
jgi:hypothetical protein